MKIFEFIDDVTWASFFATYALFDFTLPVTIKWVCYVININAATFLLKVPLFLTLPLVILFGITVMNLIIFRLTYILGLKAVYLLKKILRI